MTNARAVTITDRVVMMIAIEIAVTMDKTVVVMVAMIGTTGGIMATMEIIGDTVAATEIEEVVGAMVIRIVTKVVTISPSHDLV